MLRFYLTLATLLLITARAGAQQDPPTLPAGGSQTTASAPAKNGTKATRPTPQTKTPGTVSGSSVPPAPGKDRAIDNDLGRALSSGAIKF